MQGDHSGSKKLNRTVVICHVLRYTPFYQEVKRILKSGQIGLPFEAAEAGRIPGEKEAQLRKLFEEDEPSFYQALQKEKTEYQTALYLYMKWGAESYPSYKEAGISDRIYYDTFRDMEIWCRHCLKETGIPGMKQYQWTSLPIKRKIYRLGRLQYEPSRLKDENWEEGKEIPVLEVHIPEGEPLDVQAVKDSFKEAAGFLKKWFLISTMDFTVNPGFFLRSFTICFQNSPIFSGFRICFLFIMRYLQGRQKKESLER